MSSCLLLEYIHILIVVIQRLGKRVIIGVQNLMVKTLLVCYVFILNIILVEFWWETVLRRIVAKPCGWRGR